MLFKIFDVSHGFCAYAVAQNGNVLVFDCGHKSRPERRPSDLLPAHGCAAIEYFFVLNYDEDHITDLPRLRRRLDIAWLYRNLTVSPEQLRSLKLQSGPISPAMESLLQMMGTYQRSEETLPPTPGIEWRIFHNDYGTFVDTNNLSMVVFLDVGDLTVVMPGDLERAGWLELLEQPSFGSELGRVDVFVAAHHGRETGYCSEVFHHCHPDVVVFSDSDVRHATQEMASTYGGHARGVPFGNETRYVLTTRQDGDLWWNL